MFTNVIERQRDLGIAGKCLDSIHYRMFTVTSSEAFLAYVLFLSKYFSENSQKITYNYNIKRICRLGLYVYEIVCKLASSVLTQERQLNYFCV